jgi:hypothetical protein
MSRDQRNSYALRLEKHYGAGTWYGQSASGTIYILATVLERVDNEFLWCDFAFICFLISVMTTFIVQACYSWPNISIYDFKDLARIL